MADPNVARAFTILEAVKLTSDGDIPALRQLLLSDILKTDHILQILLTCLPEGTDPDTYIDLLKGLPLDPSDHHPDYSTYPKLEISGDQACERVKSLQLTPLASNQHYNEQADPLTLFLIHQAYKIDAATGSLTVVAQLLEPFVGHSKELRTWMISKLLPPLRYNYDYYPHSEMLLSLASFEQMDEQTTIQTLLSKAAQNTASIDRVDIGRDLRGLVGPWMYGEASRKRRKHHHERQMEDPIPAAPQLQTAILTDINDENGWSYVNEWIADQGMRNFPRAVDAFVQWGGPSDVDYGNWDERLELMTPDSLTERYAQAGLAVVYSTDLASMETMIGSHRILVKIANLLNLDEPPDLKRSDEPSPSNIPPALFSSLSQAHLLHNALLRPQNPLTVPNTHSVALFNLVLSSAYKLLHLGNVKSSKDIARLCLLGTENEQSAELRKTLSKLKSEKMDDKVWFAIRKQMLWLHDWEKQPGSSTAEPRGVFSKIAKADLENEMFRAMLDGGCYTCALDVYCKRDDKPLPTERVESTALSAALAAYDAASNGNRTRGGVRKASEIISTFRGFFPSSEQFARVSALLSATHAMSFYSLSLQHGVPFQPVNIRAHKDPMSLIGKILDQNPRSYTHLDDLLEIGQNLVAAGISQPEATSQGASSTDEQTTNARRRVTRMAIEAALAEDDFDTAYSYVVNRLSLINQPKADASNDVPGDDISWRAAYAAGRHPASTSGASTLRRLEQRMELLSQALLLAPPAALSEVLQVWQECELQLTELIANDAAEEEKWDSKDRQIPGGYGAEDNQVMQKARDPARKAVQEEAPMGLFEVARGAASALGKNAFPLHGPQKPGSSTTAKANPTNIGKIIGSASESGGVEDTGRLRKRDMVGNMVTGGLVSGIGWVLGESY